jgi:hypothetical protein
LCLTVLGLVPHTVVMVCNNWYTMAMAGSTMVGNIGCNNL